MLDQVFDILEPLTQSSGQHSFTITFNSRTSGVISFMLGWKCFKGEFNFNTLEELVEKAKQLIKLKKEWE